MAFVCLFFSYGTSVQADYIPYEDSAEWKPLTKLPARPGDGAPDIRLFDPLSSRSVTLSDFKGQILYLEFWATWCPGCQPLMRKLNSLASKNKQSWSGKAVIAAISVDQTSETVRQAAESNGWLALRHLWSGKDLAEREALASKAFGVVELPYAVLIDATGNVVWRGDPARNSAEAQISKLLTAQGSSAATSQSLHAERIPKK